MSSSGSLSSSSSSDSLPPTVNGFTHPLNYKKVTPDEPKDWLKIAAFVAVAVGGVIALLAGSCFYGIFPLELLGGPLGCGITFIAGASILAPAALILVRKYFFDD